MSSPSFSNCSLRHQGLAPFLCSGQMVALRLCQPASLSQISAQKQPLTDGKPVGVRFPGHLLHDGGGGPGAGGLTLSWRRLASRQAFLPQTLSLRACRPYGNTVVKRGKPRSSRGLRAEPRA